MSTNSNTQAALQRLITRMERVISLSTDDRLLINKIPIVIRSLDSRDIVVREGDTQTHCSFVFSGCLVKNRILDSARRQIMSFHVAGDLPDLHGLYLGRADHNLTALGPATIGLISHRSLHELFAQSPVVTHALWRETLIEAAILREWEVNLGGREAIARVAHLFCEIAVRLRAVGMAKDWAFAFPWTQHDIGDACGLSNVHVNRVVQSLRASDVIDWRSRLVKVLNWPALQKIAGFSPEYLHLPELDNNDQKDAGRIHRNPDRFEIRP